MTVSTTTGETLAQRLLPRQGILENKAVSTTVLVIAGCLLTALLAQIRIYLPFTPIPIVGSTLGALLAGSLLGSRLGFTSMLLYLVLGAIGFPFFTAGNSGITYMQGATFGYLMAFPVVAAVMGWFAERGWDRRVVTNIITLVIGSTIFYVLGAGWMAFGLGMGIAAALSMGVVPFLVGDALKVAIAFGVMPGAWKLLGMNKARD